MALLKQDEMAPRIYGFVCDRCEATWTDHDGDIINYYQIDHCAGYGTPLDNCRVKATLCDRCLFNIVLQAIPHAQFVGSNGKAVSREMVADLTEMDR